MFEWKEIIGYLGMIFIVGSFFFKDVKVLRIVNMIGGTICAVYGFMTNTIPTAILNICCIGINLFQLFRKK